MMSAVRALLVIGPLAFGACGGVSHPGTALTSVRPLPTDSVHGVMKLNPDDGLVMGSMSIVGPPHASISGTVVATDNAGRRFRSPVQHGLFTLQLPPGTYTFVGHSPRWGHGAACPT